MSEVMAILHKMTTPLWRALWIPAIVAIAVIYVFLPFESFLRQPFWDLGVYRANFGSGYHERVLNALNGQLDVVASLTQEHAWLAIVVALRDWTGSFENAFTVVSMCACLVFLAVTIRSCGWLLALVMLFHPLMTNLLMSQIRSALAMALIYVAWRWRDLLVMGPSPTDNGGQTMHEEQNNSQHAWLSWIWALRGALAIMACFIHTAMVVMLLLLAGSYLVSHLARKSQPQALVAMVGVISLGVLILSPARFLLLNTLGDRRAEYNVDVTSTIDLVIWGTFALFFLVRATRYLTRPESVYAVICLSVFIATSLVGTQSSRVFALTIPLFMGLFRDFNGVEYRGLLCWFFATTALYLKYWYPVA